MATLPNGIRAAALAAPAFTVSTKDMAAAWGRAPRGIEQVRVVGWDEDEVTLGIDAAQQVLAAARFHASDVRQVVLAGIARESATLVSALGCDAARVLVQAGPTAALDALHVALASHAPTLVVASRVAREAPGTENALAGGAGAVAFLVVPGGAVRLEASAQAVRPVPGAVREDLEGYVRSALPELGAGPLLAEAAFRASVPAGTPRFSVGAPVPGPGGKPLAPEIATVDVARSWGDLGSIAPLVQLVEALRESHPENAWGLVAEACEDAALVLALRVVGPATVAPLADVSRRITPVRALQESRTLARFDDVPDAPMGAYVPLGTWVEDLPARLRLVAQRCAGCGRTLFPPRGACPQCRGRKFAAVTLPASAFVHSATRIGRGGAPSEFALEQSQTGAYWVAIVEWPEAKVRVTARLTGFDESGPAIGDSVRAVVRRLFEQQGAVRYGVKFAAN